ncbi:Arc2, partial [Carabus blaptoides fortunei]
MDLTYLPHLTDDELTHESICRGLPDGGSATEKRSILEALLTLSLADKYPVQPPNPKDEHAEYVWCVAKLSELSSSIESLGSPSPAESRKLVHRFCYRSSSDKYRNLYLSSGCSSFFSYRAVSEAICFIRTADALVFFIPPATPPLLPPASSSSFAPPTFNKYVQVSRWMLTYNGVGSINAFIERVEEKAVSFGVREEQLFQQAGELFTDHALVWFRSIRKDVKTWSELVTRLRTAFLPADYECELWDEIRARTQGPEERVEIFVAVMQNLLKRFFQPVPEEVRLQVIIRNLQPTFQSEMSVRQCHSIPTLLAVCRNIEDAAHRVAAFKNPPTRATRLLEPELTCRRERNVVHQVETSSKPPRLCWKCRSPDHFNAACPQPHRKRCYSCGKAN